MIFKWLAIIAFIISIADFFAGAYGEATWLAILAAVFALIAYSRNVPCMNCMSRIHKDAKVCPQCSAEVQS